MNAVLFFVGLACIFVILLAVAGVSEYRQHRRRLRMVSPKQHAKVASLSQVQKALYPEGFGFGSIRLEKSRLLTIDEGHHRTGEWSAGKTAEERIREATSLMKDGTISKEQWAELMDAELKKP